MNQIATVDQATATQVVIRKPQEVRVVSDPIAVLDTARFEHMQRIATVMAHSNLIPDTLCFEKNEAGEMVPLPMETVTANCFLVVNQAVRWNMDPFAVAQCVSVVHGKLCYEGKLIAAVMEGKLGVELEYEISGLGDTMKVVVSGAINGKQVVDSKGRPKEIDGTVGDWKTTGRGSPWDARGGHKRMLRYRGAREWGRVYAPGLMLGVYSDDEMEDLSANHRAMNARIVQDAPPVPPAPPAAQVTHQPEPPATAADELVTAQPPAEEVEWSEPEEQEAPPAPPADAPPTPPQEKKDDPISTGRMIAGAQPTATHTDVAQGNPVATVVGDFPGDRPMTADDLDIPPYLRRTQPPKEEPKEKEQPVHVDAWLESLGNVLSGCESTEQLAEAQNKYQAPMKGKVSKADWAKSQTLVMETFSRISEAE